MRYDEWRTTCPALGPFDPLTNSIANEAHDEEIQEISNALHLLDLVAFAAELHPVDIIDACVLENITGLFERYACLCSRSESFPAASLVATRKRKRWLPA